MEPSGPSVLDKTQNLLDRQDDSPDKRGLRKEIAALIFEYQRNIDALKVFHNTLAPINRLPPELLASIFALTAQLVRESTEIGNGLAWISVTHVCQLWRDVALDCTSLWCNLPYTHPALLEAMVERSKGAPLCIDFEGSNARGGPRDGHVLRIGQDNAERLLSLKNHAMRWIHMP